MRGPMPRTKNQPPPDHDENRLPTCHAGAVEHMPVVGTRDPTRQVIVPLSDTEREELRTAGKKVHAERQRRLATASRAGRHDGSTATPIP